ncbi:MAG: hypothetical protein LBG28_00725 [Tannerella sp.]|nr:hypothetical protein [Tannerella sp.]
MKKQFILLAAILNFCCYSCKNEKLAIAGNGWSEIAIIDKTSGLIEWRHRLEEGDECNDIEITPDGNVLFAYSKGAKLINRNHEIIWDYKAKENEEIHTATRLNDGNFMIAACGNPARIVELDKNGQQTKDISFQTATPDISRQFRQIAKNDTGTYFVPLTAKQKILQISPEGRYLGSLYVGYDVFSVKVLDNDNLLVSCGNDRLFAEVNPAKQHMNNMIVTNNVRGASMLYVAEIFLYKNGNKLIANSNMYSDDKSQPLLIETDQNNNVVWTLPFNKEIKNITSVYSFYE